MKKRRRINIAVFIFFMVIIFGIISSLLFNKVPKENDSLYDMDNPITATICEITEKKEWHDDEYRIYHTVYVDYEHNGEKYEHMKSNLYTSSMYEGKDITIYLKKNDPTKFKVEGEDKVVKIVSIIFTVVALLFLVPVAIFLFVKLILDKGNSNKKAFDGNIESGMLNLNVIAKIEAIIPMRQTADGIEEYFIKCKYVNPATGVTYYFEKEHIPKNIIDSLQVGSDVSVMVNDKNYGDYQINI